MADFYLIRKPLSEARKVAEKIVTAHPNQRMGTDLLDMIERRRIGQ
jgi:hypothetical protein